MTYFDKARMKLDTTKPHSLEVLEFYARKGGYFINFSDYEGKIGKIKGKTWYNTPTGIYCYFLSLNTVASIVQNSLPFGSDRSHINILKMKDGGKWLDLDKYRSKDLERDLKKLNHLAPYLIDVSEDEYFPKELIESYKQIVRDRDLIKAIHEFEPGVSSGHDPLHQLNYLLRNAGSDIYTAVYRSRNALKGITKQLKETAIELYKLSIALIPDRKTATTAYQLLTKVILLFDSRLQQKKKDFSEVLLAKVVSARKRAKDVANMAASEIWNVTRMLSISGKPEGGRNGVGAGRWNTLLRNLGYEGAKDKGMGLIHPNEPEQAVFFHPNSVILVKSVINPQPALDKFKTQDTKKKNLIASFEYDSRSIPERLRVLEFTIESLDRALARNDHVQLLGLGQIDLHYLLGRSVSDKNLIKRIAVLADRHYRLRIAMQKNQEDYYYTHVKNITGSSEWYPSQWPAAHQKFLEPHIVKDIANLLKDLKQLIPDLKQGIDKSLELAALKQKAYAVGRSNSRLGKYVDRFDVRVVDSSTYDSET